MGWARYNLTGMEGLQGVLDVLRRHYPTIQEIRTSQTMMHPGLILDVREKDYGIWEWNNEILPDVQTETNGDVSSTTGA